MLATRMRMIQHDDVFYSYETDYSCRFNDDDSAQLTWTPGGAGTEETWTFATWIKRCNLGSIQQIFNAAAGNEIQFTAANKLQFTTASGTLLTTQVFRDPTSWFHLCLAVDTTQSTAADRVNLYINGTEVTAFDTETYMNQNEVTEFGKAAAHTIAANEGDTEEFDGYLAETIYSDGTQEAVTVYGEFKYGIWIPKTFSGTYGTYGWYLDYAVEPGTGNGAGTDVSGNGEHWTEAGLAANDQVLDSPTNNYPTLNPIGSAITNYNFEDGNLLGVVASAANGNHVATIPFPSTGKWYVEFTCKVVDQIVGIVDIYNFPSVVGSASFFNSTYGYGYRQSTGRTYNGGTDVSYGDAYLVDEVMAIVFDADAGTLHFYNENVDQGEAYSGLTSGEFAVACSRALGSPETLVNFGQLGFTYTPPTDYKALCSNNLPTPSIKNSSTGFDVVTYEGTGAEQSISDLDFQPDLVWIKNRDAADEHKLIDSVRGVTKELSSDSIAVEATDADGLTAFNSDGFTIGTGANGYNDNGESFVAWCFRKGTGYGFDIQTYTGTGVAHAENHDLGNLPELIMLKNLDSASGWAVYHHHALNKTDPETDYGTLNSTVIWNDLSTIFNDTAPTSSQFTVGTHASINENESEHIAYLWRSIPGFSKVFSYTGNGSTDGVFVHCGFRPRYIIIKKANTAANSWFVFDVKRDTYNVAQTSLLLESTAADFANSNYNHDVVSNGFKLRSLAAAINTNAALYVGIAIAEQPGKWSNAR